VTPAVLSTLRRRRAELIVIALVGALLLGGGLAALAGARRSSVAMDRFLAYSRPEDVDVLPPDDDARAPQLMAAVNRLPQIEAAQWQGYVAMVPVDAHDHADLLQAGAISPFVYAAAVGRRTAIGRPRVIEGRLVDPDAPFEADVDEELAEAQHLDVGSTFRMAAYGADQFDAVNTSGGQVQPDGPRVDLRVVGIVRTPSDVHPKADERSSSFGGSMDLDLSPALYRRDADQLVVYGGPDLGQPEAVRLRHGAADLPGLRRAIDALPGGRGTVLERGSSDNLDATRTAERAISVETTSLLGLGAVLLIAGLVLLAQASARLAQRSTTDLEILRAMGLRPVELLQVAAAPALAVAGLVALLSVVVAVAASPLAPVGLARLADIDVGLHLDPLVVLGGAALILLLGAGLALATAWPTVRHVGEVETADGRARPGLVARLARAGAPLTSALGAHLATDRRGGERSAPLRSAVVAGATALLVLAGVGTYTASLHHLTDDPRAEGVTWDLTIGNPNLAGYGRAQVRELAHDPRVASVAPVAAPEGQATIRDLTVSIAGIEPATAVAPVLSGRLPERTGEVALGRHTASRLGVHLGDTIPVALDGGPRRLTVVGTALLNPGLSPTMQLGDGALVTLGEMHHLAPDQTITFLLTRLRRGVDVDRTIAALHPRWGRDVHRPPIAVDVLNLNRVKEIPQALAYGLGGGAAVLLSFTLVVSATHRRRELGVLRALGATGRQLSGALTWQATWLYAAAAVVGLPLGVVAGRLAWQAVDHGLGATTGPRVPLPQLAVVAAAGLVLSILLAAVPAREARHAHLDRQD
jgi:putative ABC transport system permease protein